MDLFSRVPLSIDYRSRGFTALLRALLAILFLAWCLAGVILGISWLTGSLAPAGGIGSAWTRRERTHAVLRRFGLAHRGALRNMCAILHCGDRPRNFTSTSRFHLPTLSSTELKGDTVPDTYARLEAPLQKAKMTRKSGDPSPHDEDSLGSAELLPHVSGCGAI